MLVFCSCIMAKVLCIANLLPTVKDENRYDGDFLCETCDRSWETADGLEEHVATHVICEADGCTFTAHPKVVNLHFKIQHATGLFDKIPKSSDSKDIEAWIAERKKRYPTKDRVEEKEAVKQEKIARGEVLENPTTQPKLSSQPKDIRFQRPQQERNGRKRPQKPGRVKQLQPFFMGNMRIEIVDGLPPDYQSNKKAAVEAAVAVEEPLDETKISDDEWEAPRTPPSAENSKNMCTVLSALCAAYESNTDDDGPPTEMKAVVQKDGEEVLCDDSANMEPDGRVDAQKSDFPSASLSRKRHRSRPLKEEKKKPRQHEPLAPPSSLLQNLLVKEIRKERNQILQCIRYITENDYFECDQNAPECGALIEKSADAVTVTS